MKRVLPFVGHSLRASAGVLGSFALWTLWLLLALALAGQIYIATTHELALPQFILHRLEARLAEAGLRASFSRTSFDPTGRILIEEVKLAPVAFSEPVFQARSVYVRLSPWMLAIGQVEPTEIRITGASAAVPTMLSGTGRPEEIISSLDLVLYPEEREIAVAQFSGRLAGVTVSAHGVVPLPRGQGPQTSLPEFFAQRFPALCRQAMQAVEKLAVLDTAAVRLDLEPTEAGAPGVTAVVSARSVEIEQPAAVSAKDLRGWARIILLDGAPSVSRLDASAAELTLPVAEGVTARGVRATAYGRLRPEDRTFETRQIEVAADTVEASGLVTEAISAEFAPRPLPRLDAAISARVAGSPIGLRSELDLDAHSALVRFEASVSPGVMDILNQRLKRDVRRFFDFDALEARDAEVRFGPGWSFERAEARVALRNIRGYGVTFEEGRATVHFDRQRFYSPDAFARIGENFATGSYEHDLATHRYRFLLDGRLRPMDISRWFGSWWPNFFRQLEFPAAPPLATVDVSGAWRDGRQSAVYVYADAARPVIRGGAFDQVRTRLFIRPGYFDGLDLLARQGEAALRGRFNYILDTAGDDWKSFDVEAESTLDLAVARQIGGPPAVALLEPFQLANAPELRLRGRFEGPGSPHGRHHDFRLQASTAGDFHFQNFPLQDASFEAHLDDGEIAVSNVKARFGGGATTGKARVWGPAGARRVSFDFALKDAALGQAAGALEQFMARQHNRPPATPGKYVQEKANVRLDLSAAAEGPYTDMMNYRGQGTAALHGGEIGEVPLLGALSTLLRFTTLRLTSAQANFRIEGPKLVFPEVTLRGSDAAIDAHGDYSLAAHQFDFNAKLFPFQESGNLIKTVVGAVLTPFSNAFEVKLTGTFDDPEWRLVLGPSSLIRSLTPGGPDEEKPAAPPATTAPSVSLPALP